MVDGAYFIRTTTDRSLCSSNRRTQERAGRVASVRHCDMHATHFEFGEVPVPGGVVHDRLEIHRPRRRWGGRRRRWGDVRAWPRTPCGSQSAGFHCTDPHSPTRERPRASENRHSQTNEHNWLCGAATILLSARSDRGANSVFSNGSILVFVGFRCDDTFGNNGLSYFEDGFRWW